MSLEKGLLVVAVDKSNVVVCNSARLCCLWKRDYSAMNIDYTQRLKVQVVLQLGLLSTYVTVGKRVGVVESELVGVVAKSDDTMSHTTYLRNVRRGIIHDIEVRYYLVVIPYQFI